MSDAPSDYEVIVKQLKQLLATVEATGRAVLPVSNTPLLQSVVDVAAQIFGAAAASILLIDERENMLEFKVAHGAGQDDIIGLRIPLDQGIAGYVASTGQPIAVSKVQQDPRFNKEFASSTGYVPRSILATPLLFDDQVIGVMEVLDKIDAPTFGMQDMELLGIFARQASLAIHLGQQVEQLNRVLMAGLRKVAGLAPEERSPGLGQALEMSESEAEPGQTDLFELAGLIHAISSMGEAERKACLQIMAAFKEYAESSSFTGKSFDLTAF